MMREFRIFMVKLPNGIMHREMVSCISHGPNSLIIALTTQASLYQPIHKLITRLCILIHAENPEDYSLFVEGSVMTQLQESSEVSES